MIRRRKEDELVPENYWLTPYPLGLSDEMERLLEDFRTGFDSLLAPGRFGIESARIPAVDLVDDGDRYRLHAEMPGIKKEDLTIEVGDREIKISAETSEEKKEEKEEGGYIRRERRYSKFYSSVPLPEAVKSDKTSAELKDGVLTVTLPKMSIPDKKTKKVEVK
jgi:HSP20 family protein